jgi:hypothetical protein
VKVVAIPLIVTAVAPVKFVPLIVTLVPTVPLVGVKPVIVGAGGTTTPPFRNASRMFAVVRWIRASTRPCEVGPGTSSSAQLQEIVPAPKTQAPLGAW